MEIKAKIDFELNRKYYEEGDVVDIPDKETLIKLNEKGFIEPLTPKQIQEWRKSTTIKIEKNTEKGEKK